MEDYGLAREIDTKFYCNFDMCRRCVSVWGAVFYIASVEGVIVGGGYGCAWLESWRTAVGRKWF